MKTQDYVVDVEVINGNKLVTFEFGDGIGMTLEGQDLRWILEHKEEFQKRVEADYVTK